LLGRAVSSVGLCVVVMQHSWKSHVHPAMLPSKPSPALTSSTPAATPPHEYSAPLYASAAQTQNPGRQSCTWRG
ncbi:hypothetical protein, partial [Acinetobacter baumannii]|uniref:hypothetical protein n=1 Tax=Acinetobacter baumannii TaxID=470 RepID=UPI0038CD516E